MKNPTTPEHYKAMLSALLVNPAKGTVRHARNIPCKNILAGDDAGTLIPRAVQIRAAGFAVVRSKLIWFAATGEVPDRSLQHIDGDSANDAISNLRRPALPVNVQRNGTGYRAKMAVSGSEITGPTRRTIEEAETDVALMLRVRAAA